MTNEKESQRNAGNSNALRADDKSETFLHIRCTKVEKAFWIREANKEKSKLSAFTRKRLPVPTAAFARKWHEAHDPE